MPAENKDKELKKKIRIVILAVIGVGAFIISLGMNITGMKDAINKSPDTSGIATFSVRTKKEESLGTQKEIKVNQQGKIIEEDILVNSVPVIKLNNNHWDRMKSGFTDFELDENGNAVFKEGYILYCNGKFVNYVIFDNTYQEEVIGHIKVGTDLKVIEEKLGVPTFRLKEGIGYKTKEVYVFFYKDEIAVYPNGIGSNQRLEELFNKYLDKTYGKERTYFIIDIRNKYDDFIIEEDSEENTIIIKSIARQVIAKLDDLRNIEVEFYNGYNISTEETQKNINEKLYLTNEEDLVELTESERIRNK